MGVVGVVAIVLLCKQVIENIGISLFAGAIVSIVTASLYYVYERLVFLSKVKSMLPQFYLDLSAIKAQTGDMLSQVTTVDKLSILNFNLLKNLAEEKLNLINGYPYGVFIGLIPNGKVNQKY